MKRFLLLLALVFCVGGCDSPRTPPVPAVPASESSAVVTTASPVPAVPTSTETLRTGLPVLPPTRGEARPAGRYLVERNHALWLVSPTEPTLNRRVGLAAGSTWDYLGMVTRGPSPGAYVAETVGFTTTIVRVDVDGVVHRTTPPHARPGAISPDGRFIAYAGEEGLRLRDLGTGSDRLLGRNMNWRVDNCVVPATCVSFFRAAWSDRGRFAVGAGSTFEASVTWVFDVTSGAAGTRIPGCSMGVWYADRVLVNDGNCYSDAGPRAFWYDPITGGKTDVPPPAGRDCRPWGAAAGAQGALGVNWVNCLPSGLSNEERYARRADTRAVVVIYDAEGRAIAEREYKDVNDGGYRPVMWSVDGAGVILQQGRSGGFRFLDRQGEVWTLDLDADSVLAVMPPL